MDKSSHENYTNRSEVSLQSIKHPQQESGDQKLSAADEESLRRILLENPKILEELRQKLNEPAKAEVPSETRKRLQAIFGFFQRVACGCPSWVKAVLPYIWIRMLALFTMQLEFCKVNRTELDKLQNILKEVDETHAKVVEQVGEIEDKVQFFFNFTFSFLLTLH